MPCLRRIGDRIMHENFAAVVLQLLDDFGTQVGVVRVTSMTYQPCFLDGRAVVGVLVVDADDAITAFKQAHC